MQLLQPEDRQVSPGPELFVIIYKIDETQCSQLLPIGSGSLCETSITDYIMSLLVLNPDKQPCRWL
jgi:hypothetical protein